MDKNNYSKITNPCVICGCELPEGLQVCKSCEMDASQKSISNRTAKKRKHKKDRKRT